MSQERRTLSRKYLVIYSRVFDRDNGKILGYLSDLSPKGAMIISDDPLTINTTLTLRFDLPDPEHFGADHISVHVRVAWCSPDIDPAFWNIGFEFREIGDEQVSVIEKMIELYEFRREIPNYPTPPSMLDSDSGR